MEHRAIERFRPAIMWSAHWPGRHRIACVAVAAGSSRRRIMGAWVDEGAIKLRVERARAGESEALGGLFDEFRPDVLRLCTRMLGPVDAEDAVHETFQRAQSRLDGYDSAQPLGRWLRSIAANECIDRLRRRSLEKRIFEPSESDIDDFAEKADSILDELVKTRQQAAVRVALDRLPDRYRAPLVLRYFADLDYDAIARELGLTRSQVASSLFRAKQLLRGRLQDERESGT